MSASSETSAAVPARVNVLGVGVHALNLPSAVAALGSAIATRTKGYVCVTGVHGVSEAQENPSFRAILNHAYLNTPDGMPMVWIGRWFGFGEMKRVYGPDLLLEVCEASESMGWRHFFYGGGPGTADALAATLLEKFPKLQVVGTHTPPFRPLTASELEALQAQVAAARPDIFWVGLSTPKQERFMNQYVAKLDTRLMLGVGAAFDIHTGRIKDAPYWMKFAGVQWMHRIYQDPSRLWRRYVVNNPRFVYHLMREFLGLENYDGTAEPALTEGSASNL